MDWINPIPQTSCKWWNKVPKTWGDGRGQQQILGHPLSDANDQIQAGLTEDTWSLCHLLPFQIQANLSSYLHQSPSAHLQLCQDHLGAVTLPWWLKSCSFLRWISSEQKKSCTRTTAFGQALIAPLDIIHSESVLVWSKKKDVTKGKFSFTKSTQLRQEIDHQADKHACMDLLLFFQLSHNQSSS